MRSQLETGDGAVANLPYHIARRELDTVGKLLNWDAESLRCEDTKNSAVPATW